MSDTSSLGSMASSVTSSFSSLTKVVTAGSYLAGLGFSVGAIMKFKQHKDNPTQIPVGTPAALAAVAAGLLYAPSLGGATATKVEDAVSGSGVTASDVKAAAAGAGITSSDVDAAKSAVAEKVSG